MYRHRRILIAWALTIALFAYGLLSTSGGFIMLAQFAAMLIAVATVARTERVGVLRYKLLHAVIVGLLLATVATVLVAAGSTVAISGEHVNIGGYIGLATTNLIALVLGWRALTRPAPRRTAIFGLIAVIAELVAMLVDVLMNLYAHHGELPMQVALIGSYVATWVGTLVCVSSLVAFTPAETVRVPDARVVGDD